MKTTTVAARQRGLKRRLMTTALLASTSLGVGMIGIAGAHATTTGTPFGGTPAAVPGTVEAANYDTGGQGVGYNVTTVYGTANNYRTDGVDLEVTSDTQGTTGTGAGYDIGWPIAGQWFHYTVDVATAGTYSVSLRLAAPSAVTDGLHIADSSGNNLSGNIDVPATGAWQAWTTVTTSVALSAGTQTLTVAEDNSGWNIHYMSFAWTSSTTTTAGNTTTTAWNTTTTAGNTTTTAGTGNSAGCSANATGTELSQTGWTASSNAPATYPSDAPANAIDGNLATRFSSDEMQASGTYLEVNLGSPRTFDTLDLEVPNSPTDYARGYEVNISSTGAAGSWTTVATCTGSSPSEIVYFGTQTAQYVQVELTTSLGYEWWSVDELDLWDGGSPGTTTTAVTTTTPVAPANCSATATGTELSQSRWTASSNAPATNSSDAPANAIDGKLHTAFSSEEAQESGIYLQVDLGSPQTFDTLELRLRKSSSEYARGYQVNISSTGAPGSWSTVATCTGSGSPEIVNFGLQTAQYVQVQLTTPYGSAWSVDELDLWNSALSRKTSVSNPFGPNVYLFTPAMSAKSIQTTLDNVFKTQETNQFGTQRYALLFAPGTYPVTANIGYYTSIMGLGMTPDAVNITGNLSVDAQWNGGNATENFWRSASNLEVTPSDGAATWAVAQAGPFRRMDVQGNLNLFPTAVPGSYSSGWASGGYIADSRVTGQVSLGGQQQWISRNSQFGSWTGSHYNYVFSGVNGAPAQSFPTPSDTTLATSPVTREEPFLYLDRANNYRVFVPSVQSNSTGTTWANGNTPGTSLPLSKFFIVQPSTATADIQNALNSRQDLLFTPGIYNITQTLHVNNPDTVIMGMGMPTLIPQGGINTMQVADVPGVEISGLLFDAGPQNSAALLTLGTQGSTSNFSSDPDTIQDVFFRIGGDQAGSATTSFIDNANYSIIDDIWAWRADHGTGVGWTVNPADTGLIVNGNNVTAYGLFVEHYEKTEIVWNGENGTDIFLQNENPYDPPSQAAWMASPTQDGYPALWVNPAVTSFQAYGLGSYCFFNQGVPIHNAMAYQAPVTPGVQFHDIMTAYLTGAGGIDSVINGTGAPVDAAHQVTDIVSYP
ncbi:MAG TPA: carbohydrate-binding protein [Acidimicrobiales bacterium]|nr:carbohydrate-binding protein [Acidimicrobiales bacterium]